MSVDPTTSSRRIFPFPTTARIIGELISRMTGRFLQTNVELGSAVGLLWPGLRSLCQAGQLCTVRSADRVSDVHNSAELAGQSIVSELHQPVGIARNRACGYQHIR